MGKIKNNVVTKGFSGKFGDDLVFRQVDNKTVFAKRTLTASTPTAGQTEVRNRFAQATQFASAAVENPQASVEYKLMAEIQGLKSAYIAAVTDYLTDPEIASVYAGSYKGMIGDVFNIKPKVPYKIISITISIVRTDGTVVESGAAVANELKWKYSATIANAQVAGCKLILVARDRQGRETTFEQAL
jgi:hypothetical protein